ncbi:hypothetical protein [Aestuariispira insulae]|nr:hypothetical protein [Aestuariispira insulae]
MLNTTIGHWPATRIIPILGAPSLNSLIGNFPESSNMKLIGSIGAILCIWAFSLVSATSTYAQTEADIESLWAKKDKRIGGFEGQVNPNGTSELSVRGMTAPGVTILAFLIKDNDLKTLLFAKMELSRSFNQNTKTLTTSATLIGEGVVPLGNIRDYEELALPTGLKFVEVISNGTSEKTRKYYHLNTAGEPVEGLPAALAPHQKILDPLFKPLVEIPVQTASASSSSKFLVKTQTPFGSILDRFTGVRTSDDSISAFIDTTRVAGNTTCYQQNCILLENYRESVGNTDLGSVKSIAKGNTKILEQAAIIADSMIWLHTYPEGGDQTPSSRILIRYMLQTN